MHLPEIEIPITEIPVPHDVKLFIKREDLVHPQISGNKFWKLFYNINNYLETEPSSPQLITFGGAFSNHIAAVAALAREIDIPATGIIRGDELQYRFMENPTLRTAHENGMRFRFVTREAYREKEQLTELLKAKFPGALIIPEGGTNSSAVTGIKHMLNSGTKDFDYLCSAVGTGGTLAGLVKYADEHQQVIGFKTVKDDSLRETIARLSGKENFLLTEAHEGGYGKITEETVRFINRFRTDYGIPLDPVYTGKMMRSLFDLIENGFFPEGSRILAFHTGGLQGIAGANEMLQKQKRQLINL